MKKNKHIVVRIISTLVILLFGHTINLFAQVATINGRNFEKQNGKWLQIENGKRYDVNTKIITVKYKRSVSMNSINQFQVQNNVKVIRSNILDFIDLEIPAGSDPINVVQDFIRSEIVEIAEPNTIGLYHGTPNDPSFATQWSLNNTGQSGGTADADIDAVEAWNLETGDPSIIIGILDSGTDWAHPDLSPNIYLNSGEDAWNNPNDPSTGDGIDNDGNGFVDDWKGWDFHNNNNDSRGPYFHGTHVAGVASAKTNNEVGIAGVAGGWGTQGSRLMILGVGDSYPDGAVLDDAILYAAANGAKVITMSVSVGQSSAIDAALQTAYQTYGCFIDCCSGNEEASSVDYPSSNQYVVAVGATDRNDVRPSWSNYGSALDVTAPGVDIYSTTLNNIYVYASGTSVAAPHVAGVASLILSSNPSLVNIQVEQILEQTAEDKGAPGRDDYYGWGRVNAYQAVLLAMAYSNRSTNQTATSSNNGRRLVKDASGNYHLVFASGGEIFYRKYTASWQTPIRISSGNGDNNFPSISLGFSNSILITWQRKTGTYSYDIHFAMSTDNGSTWSSSNKYTLQTSVSSSADPLPVITTHTITYRTTVLYSTWGGLRSKITDYVYPTQSQWSTLDLAGSSYDQSPAIAYSGANSSTSYILATDHNIYDNKIYYRYLNPSTPLTWSSAISLSDIVPGTAVNKTPSITGVASNPKIHVAWQRITNGGASSYDYKIIHRRANGYNAWRNEYFTTYYQGQQLPSLTALDTNKVYLLFQLIPSIANSVYKMQFYNNYWYSPSLVSSNSVYPSVSMGSSMAKYVYTNGTSSPYTVTLSSETLSKEIEQEGKYTRSIAILDSSGAYIELQLHNMCLKMKDGSKQQIDFLPVTLDTSDITPSNCWSFLTSVKDNLIPPGAQDLIIDYTINMENADRIFEGKPDKIVLGFEINNTEAKKLGIKNVKDITSITGKNSFKGEQIVSLADFNFDKSKEKVSFKFELNNFTPKKGTFASLGHIFDFNELTGGGNKQIQPDESASVQIKELSIKNYPNPFNPSTTIKYTLPVNSKVELIVYDMMGREVKTLVSSRQDAGYKEVVWNGRNNFNEQAASGIYVCRLKATSFEDLKVFDKSAKLILLK